MSDVRVPEDKFYTLPEVISAVQKTLDLVSEQSKHNRASLFVHRCLLVIARHAPICESECSG